MNTRYPNIQKYDNSRILPIKAWNDVISITASVEDSFFSYINHKNPNCHNLLPIYKSIIMLCSFLLKAWFTLSKTLF